MQDFMSSFLKMLLDSNSGDPLNISARFSVADPNYFAVSETATKIRIRSLYPLFVL